MNIAVNYTLQTISIFTNNFTQNPLLLEGDNHSFLLITNQFSNSQMRLFFLWELTSSRANLYSNMLKQVNCKCSFSATRKVILQEAGESNFEEFFLNTKMGNSIYETWQKADDQLASSETQPRSQLTQGHLNLAEGTKKSLLTYITQGILSCINQIDVKDLRGEMCFQRH